MRLSISVFFEKPRTADDVGEDDSFDGMIT